MPAARALSWSARYSLPTLIPAVSEVKAVALFAVPRYDSGGER